MIQSYGICLLLCASIMMLSQSLFALDQKKLQVPSINMIEGTSIVKNNTKSFDDYTLDWEYGYDNVINRIFFQRDGIYCVSQRLRTTHMNNLSYQGKTAWSTNFGDTSVQICSIEKRYDTIAMSGLAAYTQTAFNMIFNVYAKTIHDSGKEISTITLRENDSCIFLINTTQNGVTFSDNGDIVSFTIIEKLTQGFIPLFMRISPSKKILVYSPKDVIVKGKNSSVSIESMIRNTDNTYTCFGFFDDTTRSYFLYKLNNDGEILHFREWEESDYQIGKPIIIPLPSGRYCFIINKCPNSVQFIPVTHCTVFSEDFTPENEFVIEGLKYFHTNGAAVMTHSSILLGGQTTPEQSLGTFDPTSPKWDYAFVHLNIETGTQELTTWGDSNVVERLDYIGSSPLGHILVGSHTEIPDSNKITFSLKALKSNVSTIEKELDNKISVYPNPVQNEFVVSLAQDYHVPCFLSIVNHLGEIVYQNLISESTVSILTKEFPSGMYTILLRSGTTFATRSFVIQR